MRVQWADTARTPDVMGLDARALIPFSIWLFHWSMETFYIACVGVLFFWIALRRGDTPTTFLRKIINKIFLGNRNTVDSVIYRRRIRFR